MSIEQDTDDSLQLRSDLTDAERQAADAGALAAFRQAFGGEDAAAAPSAATAAQAPGDTTGNDTGAGAGERTGNDSTEDPYKDLPAAVRDRLADEITLRRDLEAMKGRVAPVQQKLSKVEKENAELRRQLADRDAAAAPSPALDKVRGELPEVADAIEEATTRLMKRAPAETAETTTTADPAKEALDRAEKALAKVHSDWIPTMNSTDYKLWTASKGDDYANEVQNTSDPVFIAASLTEFKASHRPAAGRREPTEQDRRQQRAADAVVPSGRAAPPGDGQALSELDAAIAAFNGR